MDPVSAFGIVTGGIQTVQIIALTLQGLWVLRGKFTDADRTINSLIGQLKTIQSAITQLHDWAKSTARGSPQHDDFLDSLDVAVDGCHAVMEVLSEEVARLAHDIPNSDTGPLGIRARMRIVWNEPSMRDHEQRLQAQVLALQLLLQVCQWCVLVLVICTSYSTSDCL